MYYISGTASGGFNVSLPTSGTRNGQILTIVNQSGQIATATNLANSGSKAIISGRAINFVYAASDWYAISGA